MHELFARCASGFEAVLADELRRLGIQRVRPLKGGVAAFGNLNDVYRACLFSRVATRIQLVLARIPADDAGALYEGVRSFSWEQHMALGATFAVNAHGQNAHLRNTKFTALKVKDAVCDRLRDVRGARPDVDPLKPDFAIDVSLHASKATLYLNVSGPALHQRGYRESGIQTQAPLKETLAAGILLAAGWPACSDQGGGFVDPLCGSGTLAIEAALVAFDIAPGLLRQRWGFAGWQLHDDRAWNDVLAEALERKSRGASRRLRIVAADIDGTALDIARANARRAGVGDAIEFHQADCADAARYLGPRAQLPSIGLLAANPPYGQRLAGSKGPEQAHAALARAIEALPESWDACVITPDAAIDTALGCAPDQTIPCYNGPLEASIRIYRKASSQRLVLPVVSLAGVERSVAVAEANSQQFASRLRKVARERAKWARREGVSCYRIYDADLPDYACAIDVLEGTGAFSQQRFVRLAEYQAPATVDAARAQRRHADTVALVPAILDLDPSHVFGKVRRQAKGGGQYREAQDRPYVVHVAEGGYVFEVDLNGKLDTGLFLDHRITRQLVGNMAPGARFLNLFAYTGSATVYAAGGGAAATTTVDLSSTYLDWARRNMQANGFVGPQHRFARADALSWLGQAADRGETFDLVFCDPPTFSNSKAMRASSFEVQRDHVALLAAIERILAPEGAIVFSCNRRSFKLDAPALEAAGLVARDITPETIPHDFARTQKIHHCFVVKRSPAC